MTIETTDRDNELIVLILIDKPTDDTQRWLATYPLHFWDGGWFQVSPEQKRGVTQSYIPTSP